jgi:hypothetical protein
MVAGNIILNYDSLNSIKVLITSVVSTAIFVGFLALLKKSNSYK